MKSANKLKVLWGTVAALAVGSLSGSEVKIGFERLGFEENGSEEYAGSGGGYYWNGSNLSGGFRIGGIFFKNEYTEAYSSWSGFAYSETSDTETGEWGNQYSAATGEGFNSPIYLVGYAPAEIEFPATVESIKSIVISNTTYTAKSMENGDAFAKKFGDDSATIEAVESNYPDWLLLKITAFAGDKTKLGQVDTYLADFRYEDDGEDYILDTWREVDLSSLGNDIRTLSFSMESSDNSSWGMNTPSFFAVGGLTLSGESFGGYLKEESGWVDTGEWMGYVYPVGDYVYVLNLGKYIYCKAENLKNEGAWIFVR